LKPAERDSILYLEDMALSMARVQEYTQGLELSTFIYDYKTVDAVVRNFEIIGEASKHVSKQIKDKYPTVPWEEMYRLRNRISHEYFGIDYEILWDIATNHLPQNHGDILVVIENER
jgi:uncharacterized protein with HEPN domain